jgi:hypothetical protein
LETAKEIVGRILETRHEPDSIEIKGPLTVIREAPSEIEKDLVAIANSAPDSEGWLIFGIDNNYNVIGTVDTKLNPLSHAEVELCSQRLSQIASSTTSPHVMYDWNIVDWEEKKLVAIRIKGRKRGHFYQAARGQPPYRLDGHTKYADEAMIRSWLEEAEYETTEASDPTQILALASLAITFLVYSWFVTWVTGLAGYLFEVLAVVAAGVLIIAYAKSWNIERLASWSRKAYPIFLSVAICILVFALALEYTLASYSMVSRFEFHSYLEYAPTYALYLALLTLGSGILSDLPVLSIHELVRIRRWIYRRRKYLIGAMLVTIAITFLLADYSRIDSNLALTVPTVRLVESRYVTDGVVTIYQNGSFTQYGARTVNLVTIHFLLPAYPLVSSVFFPLQCNSSSTPEIVDYQGISSALIILNQITGKLEGVNLILDGTGYASGYVAISYYNEFNASKFALIPTISTEVLQSLGNGTNRVRTTFEIVNRSPYTLEFESIPLSFGSVGGSPYNVTWIPTAYKFYSPGHELPGIYYGDRDMTVSGSLKPFANMTLIVTYNSV